MCFFIQMADYLVNGVNNHGKHGDERDDVLDDGVTANQLMANGSGLTYK